MEVDFLKKSGYDPKAIAHIEADEQERSLKEKLEELRSNASSDRPEAPRAVGFAKEKLKTQAYDKSSFPKGSYRYGEDGSVEEIIEACADVTLEDIPMLPESVHNPGRQPTGGKRKPARRVAPYEVKMPQKKKDKPVASEKPPEVIGSGPAGHRSRVRDRFLKTGLKGFSPHEVMEILLFYTVPRRDTKSIGRELIDSFGTVHGVFDADPGELIKIPFVTERTVRLFKLIPAVADFHEALDTRRIRPYEDYGRVMQEFVPKLQKNIEGKLRIACFSADLKLMCVSDIPLREDDFTLDTVRLTAKHILEAKCSGTVLVHSHNGSADPAAAPTENDIDFTGKIGSILAIMGIELIDHVILGAPKPHSLRHNLNWEQLMTGS